MSDASADDAASTEITDTPPLPQEPDPMETSPPEPKLSDSGKYHYDGTEETFHHLLGKLVPGLNDFSGVTHPEALDALEDAVGSGLLRPV